MASAGSHSLEAWLGVAWLRPRWPLTPLSRVVSMYWRIFWAIWHPVLNMYFIGLNDTLQENMASASLGAGRRPCPGLKQSRLPGGQIRRGPWSRPAVDTVDTTPDKRLQQEKLSRSWSQSTSVPSQMFQTAAPAGGLLTVAPMDSCSSQKTTSGVTPPSKKVPAAAALFVSEVQYARDVTVALGSDRSPVFSSHPVRGSRNGCVEPTQLV